ncbi:MAG TPA: chemotaxis protein CheW [Spirochaetota bacterium]|nr:chemotaxis protein CheW [Spirochaetota bacterium]HPI22785.1 chemotaxis protein CheW [Spirochaetota bacterium]HPU90467.1 chemotaxis protein CheW [Spirochaetota bacterium]
MYEPSAKSTVLENETLESAQYVTFVIGAEVYGVPVLKVQEIIGMTQITHVPNSLPYMKGVINLRGTVVPVVDMRIKFRMEERAYEVNTVILIVEVRGINIGMIVDAVSDVVEIPIKGIQDTPHFSAKIETDFISGIGNRDDQLVIILDVDRILSQDEVESIERK